MGWLGTFFNAGKQAEQDPEYSEGLAKVERILTGMPEEDARFIACLALLTAKVAHADTKVSEGEKNRIRDVLKKQMNLADAQVDAIAAIVLDDALSHSFEHHLVLRRLNELTTREQKHAIVRVLFHVACEDDISEVESEMIGGVASGLLLPRSEFIALRSEFKQHLSVLKGLPK
jgi:uncharacterized tellurite resistance protein B-like protein